jgi:hypothetical protein
MATSEKKAVPEADYREALKRLRPFLLWANQENRKGNISPWAVRQALITGLTFMEYHAREQGVAYEDIMLFDEDARNTARELADNLGRFLP